MRRTFAIVGAAVLFSTLLNALHHEMAAKPRPQAGGVAEPQATPAKTDHRAGRVAGADRG